MTEGQAIALAALERQWGEVKVLPRGPQREHIIERFDLAFPEESEQLVVSTCGGFGSDRPQPAFAVICGDGEVYFVYVG